MRGQGSAGGPVKDDRDLQGPGVAGGVDGTEGPREGRHRWPLGVTGSGEFASEYAELRVSWGTHVENSVAVSPCGPLGLGTLGTAGLQINGFRHTFVPPGLCKRRKCAQYYHRCKSPVRALLKVLESHFLPKSFSAQSFLVRGAHGHQSPCQSPWQREAFAPVGRGVLWVGGCVDLVCAGLGGLGRSASGPCGLLPRAPQEPARLQASCVWPAPSWARHSRTLFWSSTPPMTGTPGSWAVS